MANITTHQLAELLLGIARSQQAIVEAMENSKAGFKSTHFRPSIETAARLRTNRAMALADFPSRLLLQMVSRAAPDMDQVAKELELMLTSKPAGALPSAQGADDALDMTKG